MKSLLVPPFIRTRDSVSKIMADVLFALLPCCAMAWVAFGWAPIHVILVACGSALLTEFVFARLGLGKRSAVADGSSLVTGTLLACTLAPFTPLHIVAFGAVMAVLVGKLLPGGLGRNRFNPALVGREFMTVFSPAIMTSGAIWYSEDAAPVPAPSFLPDEFYNNLIFSGSGAVGEYSVLFLVLGGLYLLLRQRIDWHIPTALMVSFTLLFLAFLRGQFNFSLAGVMLGAIFMATDMPTSASTRHGQLYYGAMIGAVAVLCIARGIEYAYMSYAILLLNAFTAPINWVFRTRVWGETVQWPLCLTQAGALTLAILACTMTIIWLHHQGWLVYLVCAYGLWCFVTFFYQRKWQQPKPD